MRFKIESKHTMSEVFIILQRMMETMEKNGATSATGVNLYFNPISDEGEEVVLTDESQTPIKMVVFRDSPKKKVVSVKRDLVATMRPKPELRSVA